MSYEKDSFLFIVLFMISVWNGNVVIQDDVNGNTLSFFSFSHPSLHVYAF